MEDATALKIVATTVGGRPLAIKLDLSTNGHPAVTVKGVDEVPLPLLEREDLDKQGYANALLPGN